MSDVRLVTHMLRLPDAAALAQAKPDAEAFAAGGVRRVTCDAV